MNNSLYKLIKEYPENGYPLNRIFFEYEWAEILEVMYALIQDQDGLVRRNMLGFWRDSVNSFGKKEWIAQLDAHEDIHKKLYEMLFDKSNHFLRNDAVYTYGKLFKTTEIAHLIEAFNFHLNNDPILLYNLFFELEYLTEGIYTTYEQIDLLKLMYAHDRPVIQLAGACAQKSLYAADDELPEEIHILYRTTMEKMPVDFDEIKWQLYDQMKAEGKDDYSMAEIESILNVKLN